MKGAWGDRNIEETGRAYKQRAIHCPLYRYLGISVDRLLTCSKVVPGKDNYAVWY